MKIRRPLLVPVLSALVLSAFAVASAMPTAVERGVVVQGGLQFQKTIVLDQNLKTEGGGTLLKGSYEVRFESLGSNRVRASFFQGATKRGEANGIIIVSGNQTSPGGGPHTAGHGFGHVKFGPEYGFKQGAGKLDLVVGQQGTNQILIGLLLPAVQKGGIVTPTDLHGVKLQPAK
ncbi:MAG TPA: hypothetical protein VGM13_15255 [Thermoanaerobaculia bacterium]|jgi:hypothetical protein